MEAENDMESENPHPLPVKDLMRRIQITDLLSLPKNTLLEQITTLQHSRINAIENAKTIRTSTKSAQRNNIRNGKASKASVKSDTKKLAALLKQFTPAQLAALKSQYTGE